MLNRVPRVPRWALVAVMAAGWVCSTALVSYLIVEWRAPANGELEQLRNQIDEVAKIAATAKPGPRGERGPSGPSGPPGPQGEQGEPGESPDVNQLVQKDLLSIRSTLDLDDLKQCLDDIERIMGRIDTALADLYVYGEMQSPVAIVSLLGCNSVVGY